jgi:RHS repeat-associated protein
VEEFSYDANGNPVTWTRAGEAGPRTLRFDALDRLVAIEGAFTASYAYGPFGRRTQKSEGGASVRYQYDGLDIVAEYDAGTLPLATFYFGPGIDEPLKMRRDTMFGTILAAYHGDGLGSVTFVSKIDDATELNSYRYGAFGEDVDTSEQIASPYTYTGRERDASGLTYYRSRYYLPAAGRFFTPDPIGLEGGVNPYAYAGSNPVNFTDPFGLAPWGRSDNAVDPISFAGLGEGYAAISGTAPLSQSNQQSSGVAAVGDYASRMAVGELLDVYGGIFGTLNGIVTGFVETLAGVFTLNERMLGRGLGDLGGALSMPRLGSHGGLRHPGGPSRLPESGTKPNNASIWHDDFVGRFGYWNSAAQFGWIERAWTGPGVEPGPYGQAYRILGTVGFGIAGALQWATGH